MSKDKIDIEYLKTHKDKKVKDFVSYVLDSDYFVAYIGSLTQLQKWEADLIEKTTSLKSTGDEDMKAFEKYHKFMMTKDELYEKLALFRAKLTPEQVEKAKEATTPMEKILQESGVFGADNS